MKKNLKSIGAVVAGFVIVAVLSVATDALLETNGIFPQQAHPEQYVTWMWLLALLYRSAYAVLGGYLAAKLAPSNPMKHAKILAVIGTVAATLGLLANLDKPALWYPVLLAVLSYPSVWWGGKLATNKK